MKDEYYSRCGICGNPVKYANGFAVEYHDCKPVPRE